jgi:hypothetical protein
VTAPIPGGLDRHAKRRDGDTREYVSRRNVGREACATEMRGGAGKAKRARSEDADARVVFVDV